MFKTFLETDVTNKATTVFILCIVTLAFTEFGT